MIYFVDYVDMWNYMRRYRIVLDICDFCALNYCNVIASITFFVYAVDTNNGFSFLNMSFGFPYRLHKGSLSIYVFVSCCCGRCCCCSSASQSSTSGTG